MEGKMQGVGVGQGENGGGVADSVGGIEGSQGCDGIRCPE